MSLEQTVRRRQAVSTIHEIVGAMRAIAAGRIQGAQHAMAVARRYLEVVLQAIGVLAAESGLRSLPLEDEKRKPPLLLVLTSEQPLCGAFNQDVVTLAVSRWSELCRIPGASLLVVGQRGQKLLAPHGILPDVSEPAATSVLGLRDLVKRLAGRFDQLYARGQAGTLSVIYSRYQSVSEQLATEERILPLDLTTLPAADAPRARYHRYLPVPVLLAGLVSEYAFISLYQAAADSFASEQASRLVAMDGATRNTEHMLETLLNLERRERQGEITRQVLEMIGARFASSL